MRITFSKLESFYPKIVTEKDFSHEKLENFDSVSRLTMHPFGFSEGNKAEDDIEKLLKYFPLNYKQLRPRLGVC